MNAPLIPEHSGLLHTSARLAMARLFGGHRHHAVLVSWPGMGIRYQLPKPSASINFKGFTFSVTKHYDKDIPEEK